MVIYVVKNASRPVPVKIHRCRMGSACVSDRLHCNSEQGVMQVVSAGVAAQQLRRYKQGNKAFFPSAVML